MVWGIHPLTAFREPDPLKGGGRAGNGETRSLACCIAASLRALDPIAPWGAEKPRRSNLTTLRVNGELRLQLAEETQAPEETGGKELHVHMIAFNYCNEADVISQICDEIRVAGGEIHSESKEMLRVWCSADGTIEKLVPPPGCKLKVGRFSRQDVEPIPEFPVDRPE